MTDIKEGDRYTVDGIAGTVRQLIKRGRGYSVHWVSDEGPFVQMPATLFRKKARKA